MIVSPPNLCPPLIGNWTRYWASQISFFSGHEQPKLSLKKLGLFFIFYTSHYVHEGTSMWVTDWSCGYIFWVDPWKWARMAESHVNSSLSGFIRNNSFETWCAKELEERSRNETLYNRPSFPRFTPKPLLVLPEIVSVSISIRMIQTQGEPMVLGALVSTWVERPQSSYLIFGVTFVLFMVVDRIPPISWVVQRRNLRAMWEHITWWKFRINLFELECNFGKMRNLLMNQNTFQI